MVEGQTFQKIHSENIAILDDNFIAIDSTAIKPTRTKEETLAKRLKTELLNMANNEIAPLQHAVDLGMATDDEKTRLTTWKKYSVLLSRVDVTKAPNITWPEHPAG